MAQRDPRMRMLINDEEDEEGEEDEDDDDDVDDADDGDDDGEEDEEFRVCFQCPSLCTPMILVSAAPLTLSSKECMFQGLTKKRWQNTLGPFILSLHIWCLKMLREYTPIQSFSLKRGFILKDK